MQFFTVILPLLSLAVAAPIVSPRQQDSGSSSSTSVSGDNGNSLNGLLGSSSAAASSSNSTSAASTSSCEILAGCTSGSATACTVDGSPNVDGTTSSICGSSTNTASSGFLGGILSRARKFLAI